MLLRILTFFKWVYGNPLTFLVGIRRIPAYHVDYTTGSTHLNEKGTCSVQSIQTVSVPRIVRSKYKFYAGSRTNLIIIKPEKC